MLLFYFSFFCVLIAAVIAQIYIPATKLVAPMRISTKEAKKKKKEEIEIYPV